MCDTFVALPAEAGKREGITRSAFKQADEKTYELIKKIQGLPISHRSRLLYRHYWRAQNKKAHPLSCKFFVDLNCLII